MKNAQEEGEDKKPLEFKDIYTELEEQLQSLFKRVFLLGEMQGLSKASHQFMQLKIKAGGALDGVSTDRHTKSKNNRAVPTGSLNSGQE